MVEFSMDYLNGRANQFHREARNYRLGRLASAGRPRRRGLIAPVLASIGQGLVAYGTRLRQRYAEHPASAFCAASLDPTI